MLGLLRFSFFRVSIFIHVCFFFVCLSRQKEIKQDAYLRHDEEFPPLLLCGLGEAHVHPRGRVEGGEERERGDCEGGAYEEATCTLSAFVSLLQFSCAREEEKERQAFTRKKRESSLIFFLVCLILRKNSLLEIRQMDLSSGASSPFSSSSSAPFLSSASVTSSSLSLFPGDKSSESSLSAAASSSSSLSSFQRMSEEIWTRINDVKLLLPCRHVSVHTPEHTQARACREMHPCLRPLHT